VSIAQDLGDLGAVADGLSGLAVEQRMGEHDLEAATKTLEDALAISRQAGDRDRERRSLHLLGDTERERGNLDRAADLLESSAALSKDAGDLVFTAATLHSLGDVALDQADLGRAASRYQESLAISDEQGFLANTALCFCGLACVAFGTGEGERAGRLWATVKRLEDQQGVALDPHERLRYENLLEPIDSSEFEALGLDEAVGYALAR
jgi:tetratricopeptide (TPR) repeat protein